ncbi:IS110 family transposase [Noviherbaspirillum sp. Root189]|uniref:IS110 family transposase n=1 Tax=Noviherbaspirillum sp. Root189 TaxID=1736487 RepID=UPI00070924EE|nr:IS110 family transposase [Noviherbaspirillum sp. Root189]KRB64169.1 transposase [Noviherbaspirillum sp. Root189]
MTLATTARYTAYIGIDWADRKHDFCLQVAGGDTQESGVLEHTPEAIERWATTLHKRFGGPIAVCLETTKGPLVNALLRYEFFALFPVHAATLAGYRKAFSPSGAKDDPSDARIALDLLLRHPERLQALRPQSSSMRMLTTLVEERRQVGDAIVRITNRLGSVLKLYYPQVLDWFEHRNTIIFCDFLTRWPTVMHARRARATTLQAFFHAHRCARKGLVAERIESIRSSTPLTEDPAIIRPAQLTMQTLVAQLRVLIEAIDDFDEEIAGISKEVPDYELFASLPGAGHIQAPRLLVAFGEDRDRFIDAAQVQCYAGIAPVIERSGNRCWIHWRFACSTFLRQTFVEWAGSTVTRSAWAGVFYRQQRSKGASHGVAIRALAFKWIRILYKMWKTRQPYNEATYLDALRRHGSPLVVPAG